MLNTTMLHNDYHSHNKAILAVVVLCNEGRQHQQLMTFSLLPQLMLPLYKYIYSYAANGRTHTHSHRDPDRYTSLQIELTATIVTEKAYDSGSLVMPFFNYHISQV